jgi:hypothetical protein
MMRRRVGDQVEILLAIRNVRKELTRVGNKIEMYDVLMRLTTLYSLLNVERLIEIARDADKRDGKKEAA